MSPRRSVQLDPTSCSKIFSHVFKHPHSDVSGLLLTSSSSSVEDKERDVTTKVLDAIPLFHRESIDCAAMNEIALAHAHAHATSKNARICGMYFANGRNFTTFTRNEKEEEQLLLPDRAKGLADAIAHNTTHDDEARCVYVLFVDAGKLKAFVEESSRSSTTTLLPFRVFSRESNNENNTTKSGGGSELKARSDIPARVCVPDADERQRRFDRDVADFDDHFDDVSKDWRNTTTTTT